MKRSQMYHMMLQTSFAKKEKKKTLGKRKLLSYIKYFKVQKPWTTNVVSLG